MPPSTLSMGRKGEDTAELLFFPQALSEPLSRALGIRSRGSGL